MGVALGGSLATHAPETCRKQIILRIKDETNLFIARTLSSVGRVCFNLWRAVHSPQPGAFVLCFVVPHVLGQDAHYRARFFYAWRHFVLFCMCMLLCSCVYLWPESESIMSGEFGCERAGVALQCTKGVPLLLHI